MSTHGLARSLGIGAFVVLVGACSSSAQQARTPSPGDVVATVGSVTLTAGQIDEKALEQPAGSFGNMKLSQAIYEARRAAADELVGGLLLDQEAKRLGVDLEKLIQQQITDKIPAVTEAEVDAWYRDNPQRVQGAALDQVRAPITQLLQQERTNAVRETYLDTLRAKTPVRIMLEPPRQTVSAGKSPAKGSASAPVEVIEFADFQCPFCLAAAPTVKKVMDTYGDRVRLVYRNYPLPNHPQAQPAAEAAQCANEQGQFWPYHDRLFAEAGKLSDADLKKAAADLGMNAPRFNACVDERRYKSVVDADQREGTEAGVNGTPAFFVNGRLLSGAQPFEAFKRIIDEELELKKK
ncbi:MAG: thioredoxin domain-containing protein [Acidobacteriota bacterium]